MIDEASELILAIRENDHAAMQQLFDDGLDIHHCNRADELPVHVAAEEGEAATLKLLIDWDSTVVNDAHDETGVTPLMLASDDAKVELLIRAGAKVNAKLADGRTPLMFAAQNGLLKGVKSLVTAGADLHTRTKDFSTALSFASGANHQDVVTYLRDLGTPDGTIGPSEQLILSATEGDTPKVREALSRGANANSKDYLGNTAIIYAAGFHRLDILYILLSQKGIDIEVVNDDGLTAILNACNASNNDGYKALVAAKANIKVQDLQGNGALHLAAMRGNHEIVSSLIQLGIDVNTQNKRGWTPLHWAVEASQIQIVELLLAHPNIDKNPKDKKGVTPMQIAKSKVFLPILGETEASSGIHPIVKLLLAHGAR